MKVKLPKSICIGGIRYDIVLVNSIDESGTGGIIDSIDSKMMILNGQGYDQTWRVLLHEIVHAIDGSYNADKLDEDTVERMANGLLQVAKEMKWI